MPGGHKIHVRFSALYEPAGQLPRRKRHTITTFLFFELFGTAIQKAGIIPSCIIKSFNDIVRLTSVLAFMTNEYRQGQNCMSLESRKFS